MNIDEMPAGREMDLLVAELMGWTNCRLLKDADGNFQWENLTPYYGTIGTGNPPDDRWRNAHPFTPRMRFPDYSANITIAWSVHKFTHESWRFSQRTRYYDVLTKVMHNRLCAKVAWPDLLGFLEPEDICRAALKATM